MDPSTASHRLVKDILWDLICKTDQNHCCKCKFPMSRDTFSIEHLEPWLHSENPVGLYFDLDNISFSHLKCNQADARRKKAACGTEHKYNKGCRCDPCRAAKAERMAKGYTPERRRATYLKTGCSKRMLAPQAATVATDCLNKCGTNNSGISIMVLQHAVNVSSERSYWFESSSRSQFDVLLA